MTFTCYIKEFSQAKWLVSHPHSPRVRLGSKWITKQRTFSSSGWSYGIKLRSCDRKNLHYVITQQECTLGKMYTYILAGMHAHTHHTLISMTNIS